MNTKRIIYFIVGMVVVLLTIPFFSKVFLADDSVKTYYMPYVCELETGTSIKPMQTKLIKSNEHLNLEKKNGKLCFIWRFKDIPNIEFRDENYIPRRIKLKFYEGGKVKYIEKTFVQGKVKIPLNAEMLSAQTKSCATIVYMLDTADAYYKIGVVLHIDNKEPNIQISKPIPFKYGEYSPLPQTIDVRDGGINLTKHSTYLGYSIRDVNGKIENSGKDGITKIVQPIVGKTQTIYFHYEQSKNVMGRVEIRAGDHILNEDGTAVRYIPPGMNVSSSDFDFSKYDASNGQDYYDRYDRYGVYINTDHTMNFRSACNAIYDKSRLIHTPRQPTLNKGYRLAYAVLERGLWSDRDKNDIIIL